MSIESLLNTIFFFWDQKLTSNIHKTLRKWAKSSEAETASSKRRPVQPPLPFYRKDAQPAKKWQVNNVFPPRRLIAPSLLTTEIVARSKHSSSKSSFCTRNYPNLRKEPQSWRLFVLSLPYASTRPCGPKVFLLFRALASPSTSAVVCGRALDRCSATHC